MLSRSKLCDSKLSLNQLYDCTRRAVISYFARNYASLQGYDPSDFEYVLEFVKVCYKSYFQKLVDSQDEL